MIILPLLAVLAATAQPAPIPPAVALFERDGILFEWALRTVDRDRDGEISAVEAADAALRFKAIADGDRDGRVTTYEYDRAREFIAARY